MKNGVKSTNGMVAQIADFLNFQSIQSREDANCESCGSQMQYREFHFWLSGTGMTWNIRLPVCTACARQEDHQGLSRRNAA